MQAVPFDAVYESALLVRARHRSAGEREAAFNEVFDAFRGKVLSLSLHLTGSPGDAEDAAQEVFLVVFRRLAVQRGRPGKRERSRQLARALARLSADHRTVLALFSLDGLSHREIAETLGIPEGTVWSRLHLARKKLAAELKALGFDMAP